GSAIAGSAFSSLSDRAHGQIDAKASSITSVETRLAPSPAVRYCRDAASLVSTGNSNRSLLMQFPLAGRDVWSINSRRVKFPRDGRVPRRRRRLEFAGIF